MLLAKEPRGSEVVSDKHEELITFWHVMSDEKKFAAFYRKIQCVPFSEVEFNAAELAKGGLYDDIDRTVAFFIRCRQSLAGRMKSFAPLSTTRLRRGVNEQASAWMTCVDGMPGVHARMRSVVTACGDALDIIERTDHPETIYYLDPTYLPETVSSPDVYEYMMSREDHVRMLKKLEKLKGKFILSGYDSELYRSYEVKNKWRRLEWELPNNAAGGATKKRVTEILWLNFNPSVTGEFQWPKIIGSPPWTKEVNGSPV